MATAAVTGLVTVDSADTATNWISIGGGPGGGLDNDTFIQGTGAFGRRGNATAGRGIGFNITTAIDLSTSSGNCLFNWFNIALGPGGLNNVAAATPGLFIRISSDTGGTTNFEEFAIGGGDVTPSGWRMYLMQPEALTPINATGTVVWNSINFVGLFPNWTTVPGGNINHFVMDSFAYGSELDVTGGTTSDRLTWDDVRIATEEGGTPDQLWGVIQKEESGNLLLNGNIRFGDAAGALDCYFEDKDQIITFQEQWYHDGTSFASSVADTFQGVTIQNDTGTCDWTDGVKVGTDNGGNGSLFQTPAQTTITGQTGVSQNLMHFTATDAGVDAVKLYGTQIRRATNDLSFSADATNGPNFEILGANFVGCTQADIGRAVTRNSDFASVYNDGLTSGNVAALLWNANIDIQQCSFTNNTDATSVVAHDVQLTTASTITFTGLTTSGAEQEILYTAATGNAIVNQADGSNFSSGLNNANHTRTGTGNLTVNNNVNVTFDGMEDNTEVRICTAGDPLDELDGIENATAGTAGNRSFTSSLAAGTSVDITIFNEQWILPPNNRIEGFSWPSTTTTIPISQVVDRTYNNP